MDTQFYKADWFNNKDIWDMEKKTLTVSFETGDSNMVHILSYINYMLKYMKNKWMQILHDNFSWNWQKFTTMMYDINKSMNLKKRTRNNFCKKKYFWIYTLHT